MKIQAIAPTRISLAGGGSDISPYCEEFGGAAVNMAINIRQHLTLYTKDDILENMSHQMPHNADPTFAYKILEFYGLNGMHHSGLKSSFDGSIGAGLGSSAAFAVALTAACLTATGKSFDKDSLVEAAWNLETGVIGNFGGKQDQVAASYGGFNFMIFSEDVEVFPFAKSNAEKLMPHLVLLNTGGTRSGGKIQKGFKKLSRKQIQALNKSKMLSYEMAKYIKRDDVESMGELLGEVWYWKKQSNNVTNGRIDSIYKKALKAGAYGGKLLGAGQAGYMIFIVKDKQEFISKMESKDIYNQDFSPTFDGVEVKIL